MPNVLIGYSIGAWYEFFGPDANAVSHALGVQSCKASSEEYPNTKVAGIPAHSITQAICKLIDKGYRVALCDNLPDER